MKVLIQGDSHANYFRYAANNGLLPKKHQYEVHHVNAATAQGMNNPNSKTMALDKFKTRLDTAKPDILITHLGEVDCGFVIWYWYEKKKRSIKDQMSISLDSYFKYLDNAANTVKHVIVTSPTLPTIKDGDLSPNHKVANLRKEVKASMKERTDLTLEYNNILKERCKQRGYLFVDCTVELLDKNGVIDDYYQDLTKRHDHHLAHEKIGPVWGSKLTKVLENL